MYELSPEEKKKIYAEEKARLEAQDRLKAERAQAESRLAPPASPQKAKRSMGCGTFLLIMLGVVVLGVIYSMIQARRHSLPAGYDGTPVAQIEQQFIDFTVLRRWVPGRDGTGLELLVSPFATRVQVMQLAYHLTAKYKPTGLVVIFIFDDRNAWANRDNDNFPQKEYFKHFLVTVMSPPLSAGDPEVRWTAEEREEPPAEEKKGA